MVPNFGGKGPRAEGGRGEETSPHNLFWNTEGSADFCTWARFGTHFIYRVQIGKLVPNFGGEGPRQEGG